MLLEALFADNFGANLKDTVDIDAESDADGDHACRGWWKVIDIEDANLLALLDLITHLSILQHDDANRRLVVFGGLELHRLREGEGSVLGNHHSHLIPLKEAVVGLHSDVGHSDISELDSL